MDECLSDRQGAIMLWDRNTIQRQIQTIPPTCLEGSFPKAETGNLPVGEVVVATWKISGSSGNPYCSVAGVPTLIDSRPPSTLLFGNLAIKVSVALIEIFDPSVHGYRNENARIEDGWQKTSSPEQHLARKEYTRPNCGSLTFSLTAVFDYQQGAIDVFLSEPNLPTSDMFNSFNLYGVCALCGTLSAIAEYDGL
jgi:hypothetical protein